MKKIFIIFLFIIFSSSFSLAKKKENKPKFCKPGSGMKPYISYYPGDVDCFQGEVSMEEWVAINLNWTQKYKPASDKHYIIQIRSLIEQFTSRNINTDYLENEIIKLYRSEIDDVLIFKALGKEPTQIAITKQLSENSDPTKNKMFQPKQEDWHKQSYIASHEKITVEEIENILFGGNLKKYPIINLEVEAYNPYGYGPESYMGFDQNRWNRFIAQDWYENRKLKEESYKKRLQARGIFKCLYKRMTVEEMREQRKNDSWEAYEKCRAKVVRIALTRSEKSKKRKPGDIFYALKGIVGLVSKNPPGGKHPTLDRFIYNPDDKPVPGMFCIYSDKYGNQCATFDKSSLKKFEKFKKDPSNEKVLGKHFIKYIKRQRMIRGIHAKIGTNNYYWALIGDMLNDVVVDVKKNNISPDLQKRRVLLKKYSLRLRGIKKKLDEDKYKSIDKDVSRLSKIYEDLKALTTTNEMVLNIDEAVNIVFDTNKLIQKSVLNSKDNEEEKLLALSSIYFMQSLIDSILSTIPEKYFVETKELSRDLFNDDELEMLEVIIDTMVNKNKKIKSAELTKSMDIINKYINTSDVLKTLDNLGMKNSINRTFTQNTAAEIVNQQIRDNIGKEMVKGLSNILKDIDKNELADLSNEASDVAKEVSGVAKEVYDASESFSILDKKFGGQSLRTLIQACRIGSRCVLN